MHKISTAVNRDDSYGKSTGKTEYISDIKLDGMLYMAIKHADFQHGLINTITKPGLPDGYFCITADAFTGMNRASIVAQDWPFFAEEEVLYYGQPILAYAGPELEVCEDLCNAVMIDYSELPSVSVIEEAVEFFNDYTIVKGNPDEAFDDADRVFENSYRTGIQEQAYMEPQGMIADFTDDVLTVRGSMQCPYYIKNALTDAFNLGDDAVRVIQSVTGGAFGGKEDYPSILAGHASA
ncbi:MAG TPA: aldehyde oxidase, partial [Spirochaeta sp.]|nr:aldehyde oxidase [Spirochaeta sp.]